MCFTNGTHASLQVAGTWVAGDLQVVVVGGALASTSPSLPASVASPRALGKLLELHWLPLLAGLTELSAHPSAEVPPLFGLSK
eukprot:1178678-Prorocentrum_minimum.AAC.1